MSFVESAVIAVVSIILGTFVGAFITYLTQRGIEKRREKAQRLDNLRRLKAYLRGFYKEIESNSISLSNLVDLRDIVAISSLSTLLSSSLSNIGLIPFPQATRALESLVSVYNAFGAANQIACDTHKKERKPTLVEKDFLEAIENEAGMGLDEISKLLEEIDSELKGLE